MSLTVEDGTGLASADSYNLLAAAKAYMAAMGYVGSFTVATTPLTNGSTAAGATVMTADGGAGEETLLAGDRFMFSGVAKVYSVGAAVYGQAGTLRGIEFSPAAPSVIANDTALIFLILTEEQVRRGTRTLDALYEPRLSGVRLTATQALAWPRIDVTDQDGNPIDSDEVPTRWQHAAIEVSRICPSDQSMDFPAWLTKVKAGSVEVEGGIAVRTVLSYVEDLIRPYVDADSSGYRVRRAV